MGKTWIWASILIVSFLAIIGILAIMMLTKKKKRPVDYYNLFVMGAVWFLVGIPLNNAALGFLGLILMLTGLLNKDKWKKNRLKVAKMTNTEKAVQLFILGVLLLIVILVLVFFVIKKGMI